MNDDGQGSLQTRFEFPRFEIPRFENPRFKTGHCKTGKSKSAQIGPFPNFKSISMMGQLPDMTFMDILLKFGIEANSSTFRLPRFAMPCFETGVFKMGDFKTGKFKTVFAENLGQSRYF